MDKKFFDSVHERLTGELTCSFLSVSGSVIPDFYGDIDFQSTDEVVDLIPLVEFLALYTDLIYRFSSKFRGCL